MTNMTVVLHTLMKDYLKDVKVVALQTSPGTKKSSRVAMSKVMHTNSAIREIATSLNMGWQNVGLMELEHMGHMGWDREHFLFDDMHPKFAFNFAVSNILLNALSVL